MTPAVSGRRCRCPACCADPLPTWTRAHALACEARMVAGLPDVTAHEYLVAIRARRGAPAADLLALAMAGQTRHDPDGAA